MAEERQAVAVNDCWNVESLYANLDSWTKDLTKWQGKPRFPTLKTYQGTLATGPQRLAEFLKQYFNLDRELSKIYTYAHLRHDEDVGQDQYKQANDRAMLLLSDFREETAWVEPEILHFSDAQFQEYLHNPALKDFRVFLEKLYRLKPHTLSGEMEALLAQSSLALSTAQKSFSAFNNGDLKFPNITDREGKIHELTHGNYQLYRKSPDRSLREAAFKTVHNSYRAYENTLCELLQGEVQAHLFERKARQYDSCLQASLFPHHIDLDVYKNLIKTTRENLPALHRYLSLRKQIMGVDTLHFWDLDTPLITAIDYSIDFDTAARQIVESMAPLGKEYQKDLEKGLKEDRWVDRYENQRKRSGAYSSGCYDSMPFILMNFHGTFRDMMTLAHEAGHSMHSLLSHRHQPYQYGHYPIFVAEVASTFNGEFLAHYLMKQAKTSKEKAFLINQQIDDIRATFFRQVMFAEFELKIHEWVEQGIPLTPTLLKKEYRQLVQEYHGPDIVVDEEIEIEWARIPHFYYNFYVYQYATGISAALALSERVRKEGETARQDYLKFLSSGSSKFPVELLKTAGVDMGQPHAVKSLISHFDYLVGELKKMVDAKSF